MHIFEKHCLFLIVSVVGRPLFTDTATATLVYPSMAYVCIEVNLLREILDMVLISFEGETGGLWQFIVVENLPVYCRACWKVGHSQDHCHKDIAIRRTQIMG